ncbi:MAG: helix-hairpin-helix domain-containing protein, partial [Cytophagales bacterium]
MKKRLQFWFNTYFGFSSKETVGFLLVVPILGLLSFVPFLISWVKNQKEALSYVEYTLAMDSLEKAGVILVSSPLLAFNPQDTVKKDFKSNQIERINRIPFSEADSITLQIVPGIGP